HDVVEPVRIELDERLLRQPLLVAPHVALVPPRDHRRDVQVLRPHEQLDVLHRPVHMQLARPPTLGGQVDESLDADLDRRPRPPPPPPPGTPPPPPARQSSGPRPTS